MRTRGEALTPEALREACDRNLAAAFTALIPHARHPLGERRSFGPVVAVATGIPFAFFNPVVVTDPSAAEADVSSAVAWVRSLGFETEVQLHAELRDRFEPSLHDLGLEPGPWATPGMALQPLPEIPPPPQELRMERVDASRWEDWVAGIDYGAPFQDTFLGSLVDDPAFRLVVGYLGDEPVTGAAALLTDGVVGIYAVGTAKHARRRGFGEAATWAAIEAGAEAGCSVSVLQSSEMGLGVYRRMGFVEVCRYVEFEPASDEPVGDA